jgi:hypothetical protein
MPRCRPTLCAAGRSRPARQGLLALALAALLIAGCDGGAAERRSLFQGLVGQWTVTRLTVDGFTFTDALEARYVRTEVAFAKADDGRRTVRVRGIDSTGTVRVDRRARVVLRGETAGDRQVMVWTGDFEEPVIWFFERPTAGRTTLTSPNERQDGSRAFLRALLPGESWRANQPVALELTAAD